MVVYDTVSAQLSTELCLAIPGNLNAKLAYLQQELKEHYPRVVITHTDSHLKVHGHLQEIVDLHSVLGVWFSTRDRNKNHDPVAIQSVGLSPSTLASNLPSTISDPLAVSSSYDIQYVNPGEGTSGLEQLDSTSSSLILCPPESDPPTSSPYSRQIAVSYQSGTDVRGEPLATPTSVEAATCTESDHNAVVNNSFNSSTDEISVQGDEAQNIKSFIKSWSNRKKNQEVQTDLPEMVPSPLSSGRRRKPGTPRKAKAHIPVKTEQPVMVIKGRARRKPTRYSDDNEGTPKKRIGRPPKKFSLDKVLPEEMVPVQSKLENRASQETPKDLPEGESSEQANDEWSMDLGEDVDEDNTVNADFVMEENSNMEVSPEKRVNKTNTVDEQEVKEERRGRKHKDGPCIAREAIEDLLPSQETRDVKCTLCTQVCKTRASLKQHYLRCHLERRFQCMVCGKRYGMLKELASHKLTHNRRHQCPRCDKKFATQFLLDGHMERKHINPKKKIEREDNTTSTACKHCDFEAKTKKSLRDHINRIHGEKIHQCPICDKKFALGKDLNQHVKFHTEVFQCDECGKSLKSKLALKLHVNGIHRGIKLSKEKEYVCEDCGKICRNKTHFKEHMNKIHLHIKPFKCDVCDMAFYTKHGLKCHTYTHSDVREFICDLCAKSFKSRSGLRVHRITHRDVTARPYSCSTCGKTFTQRGALVRHERIHSGDRPYKCRLCEASFNDYSILRRHVVGVHKIDDRALCGRVNMDPNSINRGRPKVPGPPRLDVLPETYPEPPTESSEILTKAAQIIIEPPEGSIAHAIETTSGAHFALVEPAQRLYQLSTSVDDHSYSEITAKVLRENPVVTLSTSSTTTTTPSNIHLETVQHTEEPVELIQLADLSPSQLMQQHQHLLNNHHHQHQQQQQHHQQQQQQTMSVVPVSMVNDIVHSALYEHQLDGSGGSYTIGMPVFPTPTTVGNMHMMQPVQPIPHTVQHTAMTHIQQQPQQQQQQPQHQQQQPHQHLDHNATSR